MSHTSDCALTELRIARAYVRLSSILEDSSEAWVLLASAGNCEIRMFRGPQSGCDDGPLFGLELLDQTTKTSVDSFFCYRITDAVPVFDDFIAQADRLNRPDSAETPD